MSADWFRNTTWDESIERRFNEKLRRARGKAQYLRIQGCMLAQSHPEVALGLLDRYFSLDDKFDHAQAHVDRATALLTLGRIAEAVESYGAALAREAEFPNVRTQAYVDLPFLIATRGIREKYSEAKEVLERHKARLGFPVQHFRRHAALALIAADTGDDGAAKAHALQALEAAALDHSGFRYHPTLGLVTEQYESLVHQLERFAADERQSCP